MTMQSDDAMLNRLLRALADTTRRRIIDELARREDQSLFELYTRVLSAHGQGLSRQGFSRHLVTLEEAGLILTRWQGTTKLHRFNPAPFVHLKTGWMRRFMED